MSDFTEAVLGAWAESSPAAKSLEPAASTWRVDLPPSMSGARFTMQQQFDALTRDLAAIELAVARLKAFIDDYQPGDAGISKALEPLPESTLRDHLALAGSAQSKGLLDPLGNVRDEFNQFVQRVREFVTDFASIETTQNGAAIARTKVNWTGDMQSAWQDAAARERIELHRQNVRVALARRALLMRLMVIISTGAAKIGLRLATPGAQLLALPAIFQFIRDVVAEVRQLQKLQAT